MPSKSAMLMSMMSLVPGQAAAAVDVSSLQQTLDDVVAANSAKYNCTLAVSVYIPQQQVNLTAVAGKVSMAADAPATAPDEQFVWGSITKISTGTAILRLVEEGKIALDDSIPQYVDPLIARMHEDNSTAFPYTSSADLWGPEVENVTVYHLATMRSGIPDFDTAKPWPPPPKDPLRKTLYSEPSHSYTPPELFAVPWVATGKLAFAPGSKMFSYSSTNFMLLGLILAQQAGAATWDAFDQASFLPADLRAELPSIKYQRTGAPSNITRLHGYDRTTYNGETGKVPGVDVADVDGVFAGWSASDFTSTISDAAVFAYNVYGPESPLLNATSQAVMLPTDPIYGFSTFNLTGFVGHTYPYDIAYGHLGATYGFDSILSFHPSLNATIAVASNMENDDQTHPADTLCLSYAAVKNSVTGSTDQCAYVPRGYYGGECKCTAAP